MLAHLKRLTFSPRDRPFLETGDDEIDSIQLLCTLAFAQPWQTVELLAVTMHLRL